MLNVELLSKSFQGCEMVFMVFIQWILQQNASGLNTGMNQTQECRKKWWLSFKQRSSGRHLINSWRAIPCCCTVNWVLLLPEWNNGRTLCTVEEHPRVSQRNMKAGGEVSTTQSWQHFFFNFDYVTLSFSSIHFLERAGKDTGHQIKQSGSSVCPQCSGYGPHLIYWTLVRILLWAECFPCLVGGC